MQILQNRTLLERVLFYPTNESVNHSRVACLRLNFVLCSLLAVVPQPPERVEVGDGKLQRRLKMCSAFCSRLEFVYILLLYLARAAGRVVI